MGQTVADHVLERLRAWQVHQVFGYPGDGINGLVAAFGKADNDPRFIQSRHEEMSAFQAGGLCEVLRSDRGVHNPMRVAWELSSRLPTHAIVTGDSGSSTNWYARCLRFGPTVRGSLSGALATMGPAVPYAIGAKFGHPDRPVIALAGD